MYRKVLIIAFSVMIVLGLCACGEKEVYKWPDSELAKLLPELRAEVKDVSSGNDYLNATIIMSKDEYKAYCDECREKGFSKDEQYSESENYVYFNALDKAGNKLSLDYDDDDSECRLNMYSAEHMKKIEKENAEAEKEAAKKEKTKAKAKKKSNNPSGDFKKMMDEYEAFMDDYVAFMKKYKNSDDAMNMAEDYSEMLEKYGKFQKKIDNVDTDELSSEDLAYYNKVTQRVLEKISKI